MKPTSAAISVSVRSVRPVLEYLRALGIDPLTVLRSAGADPIALQDPDARLPHTLALAVWREAATASGDPAFGIHVAESIRPGAFDVLDYATRSSATLGEGLERLVRYHRILHDAAIVQLQVTSHSVQLSHRIPGDTFGLPRHPAEYIVAGWIVVARQATGVDFAPVRVCFRHSRPVDLIEHQRLFRAPIDFDGQDTAIVLPRELLETPLVKADPGLCEVLDRHARELVGKVPTVTTLTERVRRLIVDDLLKGVPPAATLARKLHMSERTLQRQLHAEGTTHSSLVDALRRDLAMRYLRERDVAIAEVAFLLGFSEASSFHRAFRRWTGTAPGAYRSRMVGEEIG